MRGPNVILTLANHTFISIDCAAPGLDTTVDKRLFRPCYVNGVSPPSIFFFCFVFSVYVCARDRITTKARFCFLVVALPCLSDMACAQDTPSPPPQLPWPYTQNLSSESAKKWTETSKKRKKSPTDRKHWILSVDSDDDTDDTHNNGNSVHNVGGRRIWQEFVVQLIQPILRSSVASGICPGVKGATGLTRGQWVFPLRGTPSGGKSRKGRKRRSKGRGLLVGRPWVTRIRNPEVMLS